MSNAAAVLENVDERLQYQAQRDSTHGGLPRQLGVWSALAVLVNMIIGSGIFRVPRSVAAGAGSVEGIALCWAIGGFIALCAALSVAELSTMFPRAGGMYVYLREAYGPLPAFMLGWVDLLALPLAQAAVALVFASYLQSFVTLGELGTRMVAGSLIMLVGLINYRSLRLAALLQNVAAPGKVLALLALSITIFLFGHGGGAFTGAPASTSNSLGGFGVALVAVLFSFDGWAQFSSLAGEIRDPDRTLSRVLIGGLLLVTGVYLVANAAYLYILPIADMSASRAVAADALRRAVGPPGGAFVSALVLLSTFGALNSLMMAEPRLFYAMAQDGLFFRGLSAVHPRNHTPHRSILLSIALALVYVGFRSFEQLAEAFVIATWPFFTLAIAGVIVLRRRRPELHRPYRTFGYPVVPVMFIAAGILLLANSVVQHPASTLVSFAVTLLGWPIYHVWLRRESSAAGLVPSIPSRATPID